MPSLSAIQAKIDGASRKYNLEDRLIYKRVVSIVTVNPMLETPTSVDITDTLLDPQPFYSRPESLDIGAFRYPVTVLAADGTAAISNVEYVLFCTPNCLSLSDIQNPTLSIVFKDVQSNEEEFRITDYETIAYQGSTAAIQIYIKSFKKQNGTTNNNVNNLGG